MLLQSLKLDGFETKEVSMDIIKNKECVGYTAFRNVLVEQRIKLIKLHTLIKEITNLEKNETTGKVDHPKQSTKILSDGTKIKSVGKDICDSLGGAVYNAILSVDIKELDYIESVVLTDDTLTLNTGINEADAHFGFIRNSQGVITQINNNKPELESKIAEDINKEILRNKNIVNQIRSNNPTTKKSDKELLDLYNTMDNDGFLIF